MSSNGVKAGGEVVLSLKDISKQYGVVQALKNVSVEFFAGEIHAVVAKTVRVSPRCSALPAVLWNPIAAR
jgi:hypothetical protein